MTHKIRDIKDVNPKGSIDFIPLDGDENYWELNIKEGGCHGFFREVWPYLTFGDMAKIRSTMMTQVMWSAHGYGVKVLVKGDPRW